MRQFLLWLFFLSFWIDVSAQHQEQVFHVDDVDWGGRTLGQFDHLNRAAAVEIDGLWYFPAYTPESGIDLWRTDLTPEGTERFYDGEAPSPKFRWGNYIVFYEYDGEFYTLMAMDMSTLEVQPLLQGRKWSFRESPILEQWGDYLILAQGNDLVIQDLSAWPREEVRLVALPNYCRRLFDMGEGKVFAFTGSGSWLIDLTTGLGISFNERVSQQAPELRFAGRSGDRYYIQYEQQLYTEIYFIETDLELRNVRYLDTMRNSHVLKLTEEGAIISNYIDGRNTIDLVDLPSGQLRQRLLTHRDKDYSNWNVIENLPDGGYLLSIDRQIEALYVHFGRSIARSLSVEGMVMDIIYSTTVTDKGILIGYATRNQQRAEMFFFDYQSLSPRPVLPEQFFAAEFGRTLQLVYAHLGDNRVMALLYDPAISYEPAVVDLETEAFFYLKDFNSQPLSARAEIVFHQMLSNGMQIISVAGSDAEVYTTVLFQGDDRNIIDLKSWNNGQPVIILNSTQGALPDLTFEEHYAGVSLIELKGLTYFVGIEAGKALPGLYELNITAGSLRRIKDLEHTATLFTTDENLYVVSLISLQLEYIPRKIYRLVDDDLVLISEAVEVTPYQSYAIQQFFYFNHYLYFSEEHGDLLSYHELSGQIDTIFKSITTGVAEYPLEVTRYGNFIVQDNQLYFTASAHYVWLIWGFVFFGLSGPFEYEFVRTDGTPSGTSLLPKVPIATMTEQNVPLEMFSWETDIFLTLIPADEQGLRTFRWSGSLWEPLQIFDNGNLQESAPAVLAPINGPYSRVKAYVGPASTLNSQRIPLIYDGCPLFFRYIQDNSMTPGQVRLSFFRYDGAIRLESEVMQPLPWYQPFIIPQNFLVIDNKLLAMQSADGIASIVEYNFDTKRLRELVGTSDGLANNRSWLFMDIYRDPISGEVYFSAGPIGDYRNVSVHRLIICPDLEAPSGIQALSDSICAGDSWWIRMDGAETSYRWLYVMEGERELSVRIVPGEEAYELKLDLERGTYDLAFFLDNGCEQISLATLQLTIGRERATPPDITATSLNGPLFRYSTSSRADDYFWTVNNGTLLSGQGTAEVEVDWGTTTFGWVTLVIDNGFCGSDQSAINYVVTAVGEDQPARFQVFPNPAAFSISIRPTQQRQTFDLRVFSMDGQLIESAVGLSATTEWNVSSWPAGAYVLELRDERGIYLHRLSVIR